MLRVQGEQISPILACHTMDGQMHTVGKAIRPLFTDPVTIYVCFIFVLCHVCLSVVNV